MRIQTTALYMTLSTLLLTASCQPRDESPGTWLQGEAVSSLVTDWQFTDNIEEIFIETTPWYGIAHSTTIWCVQFQGRLYVGSYGTDKKFWEQNIESNPAAKLRIDGKIYNVSISLLKDAELTRKIDKAYNEKYDMEEVFGEDVPQWWFYRIEQL